MKKEKSFVGVAVLVAALVVAASLAGAAIPEKINYQGRLTDSGSGLPLPGSHSAVFEIYDDATAGSMLWTESTTVSADTNGVFSVVLGSVNPIDIAFEGPAFLEVEIDAETLSPRRELVSSPYAFTAMNAENLGGLPSSEYATGDELSVAGTINTPSNPVDWTQLKNVPSGFADGTDDAGGTGDGHSLDAADGDPVNVVYVDNTGNVGVGTLTPEEKLHVSGDIRLDSGGDISFGDDNTRVYHSADDLFLTADDDLMLKPDDDIYIGIDGSVPWAHFDSGNKRLGVGLENPSRELHVHKDGTSTCYMEFTNDVTGKTDDDGLMVGINGSGDAFIYNQEPGQGLSLGTNDARQFYINSAGDVAIGGHTTPVQALDVDGNIKADELFVGDSSTDGGIYVGSSGISGVILSVDKYSTYGGQAWFYDELGNSTVGLQPDASGTGGYFRVKRNTASDAFTVDGNYAGTGDAAVYIYGASRQVTFRMDQNGDNSVQLPNDAISAAEIDDEPGVASATYDGPYKYLDSGFTSLVSRTIVNPGADYCLVIGTCEARLQHVTGTISRADFGVSTVVNAWGDNQDNSLIIPSTVPTGEFFFPVTVHAVFDAASGSDIFYFLAKEHSGNVSVYDAQISILYVPTAYGTVVPPAPVDGMAEEEQTGTALPMTEADYAAEQAESEAFNRARIEREIAEMRARLEALEEEMQGQQ